MSAVPSVPLMVAIARMQMSATLLRLSANYRLDRVERLFKAGRNREARRVLAVVSRDVERRIELVERM